MMFWGQCPVTYRLCFPLILLLLLLVLTTTGVFIQTSQGSVTDNSKVISKVIYQSVCGFVRKDVTTASTFLERRVESYSIILIYSHVFVVFTFLCVYFPYAFNAALEETFWWRMTFFLFLPAS